MIFLPLSLFFHRLRPEFVAFVLERRQVLEFLTFSVPQHPLFLFLVFHSLFTFLSLSPNASILFPIIFWLRRQQFVFSLLRVP